jgi:hypothetical protein
MSRACGVDLISCMHDILVRAEAEAGVAGESAMVEVEPGVLGPDPMEILRRDDSEVCVCARLCVCRSVRACLRVWVWDIACLFVRP